MTTRPHGQFFVPPNFVDAEALDLWTQFSANAVSAVTERKVRSLTYKSNGKTYTSEVGIEEHDGMTTGMVWAIYEPAVASDPWCICFGVVNAEGVALRNPPIMVSRSNIISIEDFTS